MLPADDEQAGSLKAEEGAMPEETSDKPFRPEEVLAQQVSERFAQRVAELKNKIAGLQRELDDRMGAEAKAVANGS
jgi:hypothetical protein